MISDYSADICNCPECSYFDMDKAHCCGLPDKITENDIPHIRETVRCCHCVNLRLWELYERWEAAR